MDSMALAYSSRYLLKSLFDKLDVKLKYLKPCEDMEDCFTMLITMEWRKYCLVWLSDAIYDLFKYLCILCSCRDNLYRRDLWQRVSSYNNKQPHFLHANTWTDIPKGIAGKKYKNT